MATLPSTSSLDLDLSRLSLGGSPYPPHPHPHPHQHHHPHSTGSSASSSLERGAPPPHAAPSSSSGVVSAHGLQPHQIMQPPVHSGPPPHVQLQEPQRRRGVVKFFNSLKGFGFVVDNDPAALGGQEVFCHFSAISGKGGFRSLAEGEEVEYELVQGPKGFQAANLTGPGGRTVMGDPKARLQKPPAYMPFAPLAMPIGGPYLADPYHAQHAGVYAGSPYTQHVLYVPATASLPPSQYAYAPVPLAAPRHQPASSLSGPSASSSSPFAAPQYQSYAAPTALGTSPGAAAPAAAPAGYSQAGFARFGAGTGAFGAPQPPLGGAQGDSRGLGIGAGGANSYGAAGAAAGGMPNPSFSPPGGSYTGLTDTPPSQTGPSFGFAPFSPPSFHHAPLFGAPAPQQQQPQQQRFPQDFSAPLQNASFSRHVSTGSHHSAVPSPPASATTPSQSALFGAGGAGPVGSRSGTPATGGRSTPALGNGSIGPGSDAWKPTPSAGAAQGGILYASAANGQDGQQQ
ncbi:hypothetical protein JCM1841_003112 [Sporobolomyces salmonicolor]